MASPRAMPKSSNDSDPAPWGHGHGPISLAEKVRFLASPTAYPDVPASLTSVETHLSWVFLAGAFAYKLTKPAIHPFLAYRTLVRRQHFCKEEMRLNRRLARFLDLRAPPQRARPAPREDASHPARPEACAERPSAPAQGG